VADEHVENGLSHEEAVIVFSWSPAKPTIRLLASSQQYQPVAYSKVNPALDSTTVIQSAGKLTGTESSPGSYWPWLQRKPVRRLPFGGRHSGSG
jgi:hypothetical protein